MLTAVRAGAGLDLGVLDALAADLAPAALPSRDDVQSVAARLRVRLGREDAPWIEGDDIWALRVSPGTVALSHRKIAGLARSRWDEDQDEERLPGHESYRVPGQQGVLFRPQLDEPTRDVIREWSGPSRRRMVRSIAELDLSAWEHDGGNLAMVTFTLPDHWLLYAPCGCAFAWLWRRMRWRWEREVRTPWRCLWKREFQGRGAPHMHALMRVPALVEYAGRTERFEDWARRTWAEVCRDGLHRNEAVSPDERHAEAATEYAKHLSRGVDLSWSGMTYRDPRRIAVYFLKHSAKSTGSKEYQNQVPALWREAGSVGRFWGASGLRPAVAEVYVSRETWNRVKRVLRHLAAADAWRIESSRARHGLGICEERCLCTRAGPKRRRRGSLRVGGGWVLMGDALRVAVQLLAL